MKIFYLGGKILLFLFLCISVIQSTEAQDSCLIYNPKIIQIDCDESGTSEAFDDLITLYLSAITQSNDTSAMFEVINLENQINYGKFSYATGGNIIVHYTPEITLLIQDAQDPECNVNMVAQLTHCSLDTCISPLDSFILVEDAIPLGNHCYQLTHNNTNLIGGAWYSNALDLNFDFTMSFDLHFGNDDDGADGMMFILQTTGTNISGNGGFLGFQNLSPSVGLEFDTFRNFQGSLDAKDPDQDHMSFQKNGSLIHDNTGYLDPNVPLMTLPNIEDGLDHTVVIEWDAINKLLTCTFDGATIQVGQDIVNTLFGGSSQVYWGWTAGTGSKTNTHKVCVNSISVVDALTITAQVTDVICNSYGEIDITVDGGVPPYTYVWSNLSSNEDLNNLTSGGTYTVDVIDSCGRITQESFIVGEQDCCGITATVIQTACDDNGTPDPSDDIITLHVNAQNAHAGPSGTFIMTYNSSISTPFNYGIGGTISVAYTDNITITFLDTDNLTCQDAITTPLSSCSPPCGGSTLNYVTEGMTIQTSPDCYQLTTIDEGQSGQVWSQNLINLNNSFTMDFSLNFGTYDAPGADGLMFILQALGNNIPIGNGGSFGFNDFPLSVGFELDTYLNPTSSGPYNDPTADHLGFMTNGLLEHPTDIFGNLLDIILLNNIEDGLDHQATISWNPSTMLFSCIFDGINILNIPIDLISHFGGNPNVYWGWSGTTGHQSNYQTVCMGDIQIGDYCACSIAGVITQMACDGMGTGDESDDLITLHVDALGVNTGPSGTFDVINNATLTIVGSFPYNGGGIITVPYDPSVSFTFKDSDRHDCIDIQTISLSSCSPACTDVRISISLDNYPDETSWELTNDIGYIVASSNGNLGQHPGATTVEWDLCLPDACYYFTIYDSVGDGICCGPNKGNGSYNISNSSTGVVFGTGGDFDYAETISFCVGSIITCLEELYIPGPETPVYPGIYEASQKISSDGIIIEGGVIYSAGESIELKPGFEIAERTEFDAFILGCDPKQ